MVALKSQLFYQCKSRYIPHYVTTNLNANRIISNRSYNNIVWMCRNIGVILSVHHDKFRPFFRVVRKDLYI